MNTKNKQYVPDISSKDLRKKAIHIRALVERDGKLYTIKQPLTKSFLRAMSYVWSPKLKETVEPSSIIELITIKTYHGYGYQAYFKPSIEEVISQIPSNILNHVKYFKISGPKTAADLNQDLKALNDGYHVAQTTLYAVA